MPADLSLALLFLFGITNLIFLLLVFFSCRCLAGARLTMRLFQYPWYQKFYAKHCFFWWGFFISVTAHTTLALYLFGWPF